MIFIVALDPASIEWAGQQGELGYDHLTGVLECFLQNCFIAETANWRVGTELKLAIKSLAETGTRKRVSAIIETLCSPGRNRLAPVIDDTDFPDAEIGDILAAQVNHPALDAIVSETLPAASGCVEAFKLAGFHQSNFARERSRRACSITFAAGSVRAATLFEDCFRQLLMRGDQVTMIDPVIGREFGGNFSESLEHWCAFLDALDKPLLWTIHTEQRQRHSIQAFLEHRLGGGLVKVKVEGHAPEKLPHDRYLRCAGICVDIGRGIDLFDRDGWIRDVRLGLGDDQQFGKQYPHLT